MPTELKKPIRVRIAPSPTGPLHIGSARTALFNYLFAKKNKGKFLLRIEDTDKERSEKRFEKDIITSLTWLGLKWDEGPTKGQKYKGQHGPYRQSERTAIYEKYLKKLLEKELAFYCPCSKEELEGEKERLRKEGNPLIHFCPFRDKKIKEGVIRFKTPKNKIIGFEDLIRGKLEFQSNLIGDFILAKDIKTSLYNFAAPVDDYEMKISHIIRGEDHISNTPKQILIEDALGFPKPQFAHLPLILGPDKSKLSKRHGTVGVGEYKKQGYLTEALINFLVLLGWNPKSEKEIFGLEELTKEFSLQNVQKGGAIFNIDRLDWLNGFYIRKTPLDKLVKFCLPYLKKHKEAKDIDYLKKVVALEKERMKKLSEIEETTNYFFKEKLDYEPELLYWKEMPLAELKNILEKLEKFISKIPEKNFDKENLQKSLMPEAEKAGDRGKYLWPLRAALSGKKGSPGPFEIMEVLGKEKTLRRIKEAQNKIQ